MTGSVGSVADPPAPVALVAALVSVASEPVVAAELVAPLAPVVLEGPPALVAEDADDDRPPLAPGLEDEVLDEVVESVALDVVGVPLLLASVPLPLADELG